MLVLGDVILLIISILASYALRMLFRDGHIEFNVSDVSYYFIAFMVIILYFLPLYLFDQYDLEHIIAFPKNIITLICGLFISGFLVSSLLFFAPRHVFGREILITHLFLTTVLLLLWRSVALRVLRKFVKSKRLAVVGQEKLVSAFVEDISRLRYTGLDLKTVCIMDETEPSVLSLDRSAIVRQGIGELLREKDFDVLAFDSTNGHFSSDEVRNIMQLKFQGKTVQDLLSLYEDLTGRVPIMSLDDQWLLKSPEFQRSDGFVYKKVKRILDVIIAWLLLIVTSPLFVLIALLIKRESKGPVFFVQERLGLGRKPFKCIKFRTMVENAEKDSGPVWATESDSRITRVGRILRKTRLDELPQLWNVLRGDMTLVGPRPIREHFARKLAENIPFYELRFCVKPGLTGWAQVNYDYAGSEEGQMEKFQYDLFYVLKMSLTLDLLALFKTVKTVVKRAGT